MSSSKKNSPSIPKNHENLEAPPSEIAPKTNSKSTKNKIAKTPKKTKAVSEKSGSKKKSESSPSNEPSEKTTKQSSKKKKKKVPKDAVCNASTAIDKCGKALDNLFNELNAVLMERFQVWAKAIHNARNLQKDMVGIAVQMKDANPKKVRTLAKDLGKTKAAMKKGDKFQKNSLRTIEALSRMKKFEEGPKKQVKVLYEVFFINPVTSKDVVSQTFAYGEFKVLFAEFIQFIETYHGLKKLASGGPKKASNKLFAELSKPAVVHMLLDVAYQVGQDDEIEEFLGWAAVAKNSKNETFFPGMANTLLTEELYSVV